MNLRHIEVGLLEKLSDDENVRRGAIARDVVLGSGHLSDQGSGGMLDLLQQINHITCTATMMLYTYIYRYIYLYHTHPENR